MSAIKTVGLYFFSKISFCIKFKLSESNNFKNLGSFQENDQRVFTNKSIPSTLICIMFMCVYYENVNYII